MSQGVVKCFSLGIIILFAIVCIKSCKGNRTGFYIEELRGLSELPLEKLIQIKSSIIAERDLEMVEEKVRSGEEEEEAEKSSRELSFALPIALPLRGNTKQRPMRRYGDHYEEKGKDTKISKIFQLAVTSLSFLAFGGYLLTLIITAIRRNSATSNGNVIVLSNLQNLQGYKRPKRSPILLDPIDNDLRTTKLYEGMTILCRAYALYH